MKVSVSLPHDDVAFVDDYASRSDLSSRSAVIHRAIQLLRTATLTDAYAAAWEEWEGTEDARLWDVTAADGVSDAQR